MTIISSTAPGFLVSVEYPADGLAWARLYDNPILGWSVDETGAAKAQPVVIGQLPTPAPDTSPIISPTWAHFTDPALMVPDLWRGTAGDFFDWISGNNGAQRKLAARFGCSATLHNAFLNWANNNPELVWDEVIEPPEA